jgi:hypothetical protein
MGKFIISLAVSVVIGGMGWLTFLAFGSKWGTSEAGVIVLCTCLLALLAFAGSLALQHDLDDLRK